MDAAWETVARSIQDIDCPFASPCKRTCWAREAKQRTVQADDVTVGVRIGDPAVVKVPLRQRAGAERGHAAARCIGINARIAEICTD